MRNGICEPLPKDIHNLSSQVYAEVVKTRRRLHQYPEVGFQEFQTTEVIEQYLGQLDLHIVPVDASTGVVATLTGNSDGPCILLRADIDALPIHEHTGLEFSSTSAGVMHACGHDMHTAMLLGAAKILSGLKRRIHGTIKFVFQPAEEMQGGGKKMVDAGVLENPDVDYTFALHVWPDLPTGVFGLREGPLMASMDTFDIRIVGEQAHGAEPHRGVDPVVAAAQIALNLQTITSRETDPLDSVVLTIGSIHGGDTYNVLADEVVLKGAVRTLNPGIRTDVFRAVSRIVAGISSSARVTSQVDYQFRYPVTVNDSGFTQHAARCITDLFGDHAIRWMPRPSMASEDFAYFLEQACGAMVFLGVGGTNPGNMSLHTGGFMPDEAALCFGIELLVAMALRPYGGGQSEFSTL